MPSHKVPQSVWRFSQIARKYLPLRRAVAADTTDYREGCCWRAKRCKTSPYPGHTHANAERHTGSTYTSPCTRLYVFAVVRLVLVLKRRRRRVLGAKKEKNVRTTRQFVGSSSRSDERANEALYTQTGAPASPVCVFSPPFLVPATYIHSGWGRERSRRSVV